MDSTTKINFDKERIYKVLTNGNIIDGRFYDLVVDKDSHIKIEYNTLTSNFSDNVKPLHKLCKEIATALDKKNTIYPLKAVFIVFIVILIVLTVLITALLTVTGSTVEGLFDTLSKYSENPLTISIVCILALGMSIIGAHGIVQKMSKLKKWLLPDKTEILDKIINNRDFDVDDFCKISKKWFNKKNKYLLILSNLNWEIDSTQVNNLIIELLKRHNNIRLIFGYDDDYDDDSKARSRFQIITKTNDDILSKELKKNDFEKYYKKIKISIITEEDIIAKAKEKNDIDFYDKFIRILKNLSPTDFEIENIDINLDNIYDNYKTTNSIKIEDYYTKNIQLYNEKKNKILIEDFFKRKNNFSKINDDQKTLFFAVLYHYYFFGDRSIDKKLIEKILLMRYNNRILNEMGQNQTTQFMNHIVNNNNNALLDKKGKKNLENVYEDLDTMESIEYDRDNGAFCLKKEVDPLLINYIIKHRNDLKEALGEPRAFSYYKLLNSFLLLKSDDLIKDKTNLTKELLLHLKNDDRFFYQIFLSSKFSQVPYEHDETGEIYLNCSSFALDAWKNYDRTCELKINLFGEPIKLSNIGVNPYDSLIQIYTDSIHKVRSINLSVPKIDNIIQKLDNPFDGFEKEYEAFIKKYEEIRLCYLFYKYKFEKEDEQQLQITDLIKEIEDKLIVLLPIIDEENPNQIPPTLDIAKYIDIQTDDFDFLFLQILVIIHNNFLNNGEKYIPRVNHNADDIELAKKKIKYCEKILNELKKKTLNYKEYCYYLLFDYKYYLLVNLINKCDIIFNFKYYSDTEEYSSHKSEIAIQAFQFIEDYYGIVETFFWECWYETRLGYWSLRYMELNKKTIEEKIRKTLKYVDENLGYIPFDCGLIYISNVSGSALEPPMVYEQIKIILNRKEEIPKFIHYKLLTILYNICYNGEFASRDILIKESIKILEQILSEFSEFVSKKERVRYLLGKIGLLFSDIDSNKEEIENILEETNKSIHLLSEGEKGIFNYRHIQFMHQIGNLDKLLESNHLILTETKSLLKKDDKFYYLQFLGDYIDYYHDILIKNKIEALQLSLDEKRNEYNLSIEEHNQIEDNNDDQNIIFEDNQKKTLKGKINSLKKEYDAISRKIENLKDNRSLNELKDELDDFIKNHMDSLQYEGENHANRYLIASTAYSLAKSFHNKSGIQNEQTIKYYEIAYENYFELKEYTSFLEICLELKPYYKKSRTNHIELIEEKIKLIVQLKDISTASLFSSNTLTDTEQLAVYIYDFSNPELTENREDYSFYTNLHDKIDKNRTRYKYDKDTEGLRKYFSKFYAALQFEESENKLIKSLNDLFDNLPKFIDILTFDDIRTIKELSKDANRKLSNHIEFKKQHIDFENIIKTIDIEYKNKIVKYFEK